MPTELILSYHIYTLASLAGLDWAVIAAFGLLMVAIGIYCGRQQADLKEYFGASGNMDSLIVGISLYATLLSTVSYLATPGEIIKHGPAILCMLLGLPVAYLLVGYLIIPSIMRYRVTSAYEILEIRLGPGVRRVGAIMFISLRLIWMGMILYLSAKAVAVLMDWPDGSIPFLVAVLGVITTAYTVVGGLRAVILTDALQFVTLYGAIVLVIVLVCWWMDGLTWWPASWDPAWDRLNWFSLAPRQRLSVLGTIILGVQWWVCTAGSDQTVVQRYMAVRDVAAAKRSFLINAVACGVVTCTLAIVGFALLGLYRMHPEWLPADWSITEQADQLFPYFIGHQLAPGLSGFVLSGLFAAAMSSISSGVNAVSSVIVTDLLSRPNATYVHTDQPQVARARTLAAGIGILVIIAGLFVERVPGNFLEVSQKVFNLLVAPLFGLFFMALYVPWATSIGTIVGAIFGISSALLIAFWDVFTGQPPLGFQWIGIYSLAVQIAIGCVVSYLTKCRKVAR